MFGKKEKNKFNSYTDPTGEFPNQELKMAEWYIRHKLRLQNIGKMALFLWCVFSILFSFGYWGYYFIFGYADDQAMYNAQLAEVPNYANLQPAYSARDLQFKNIQTFQSATDKYDLTMDAYNPNRNWLANVTYSFHYEGGQTPSMSTVILPGAERPIIYFGLEAKSFPGNARLVVESVNWTKINAHEIPNVKAFMDERINFSFANLSFIPSGSFSGLPANVVRFDLANNSAFNFERVDFFVELYNNEQVVGYIFAPVDSLMSKEVRNLDLRYLGESLQVTDVKLYPVVNIFDDGVYIKPGD